MSWTFYDRDGNIKQSDGWDNLDGGHPDEVYGGTMALDGGAVT